jgi:predicted nucleotidyltransferase
MVNKQVNEAGKERETEVLNLLREKLQSRRAQLAGLRVVLFGSRADGTAQERSDFDIGLLHDGELDLTLKYDLIDWLEEIPTLLKFDVVDLEKVPESFREEALKNHVVLFE